MTPEQARAWVRVVRDVVLLMAGTYLLVQEQRTPGPADSILVGAAMGLLLGPAFLRADDWLRRRNGNGHENGARQTRTDESG